MKTLLFVLLAAITFNNNLLAQNDKPNILFFFWDDLGWKDLGCYGNDFIETPVSDKLAKEGMRFTQAYASPVCSPTRASIVSGQNAGRNGMWEVIGLSDRPYAKYKSPKLNRVLDEGIVSYADILSKQGYTCDHVGKWHIGGQTTDVGFVAIDNNIYEPELKKYAEENPQQGVGTITANSIEFLRENKDKPFFLCVSHHMVHAPLAADEDLVYKYQQKLWKTGIKDIHPVYAAMVEMGDISLGMLLEELKTHGLEDNTVVVIYSDNGGLLGDMYLKKPTPMATTIKPLRNQKGTLYEGGIRVPMIVKWPNIVEPGSMCNEMVHSFDLFSTFIEIGGGQEPTTQIMDGQSLLPLLKGEKQTLDRDALYWHFPTCMWTRNPMGAILKGNYKLIEHYTDGSLELFDLDKDIGETINLVYKEPEKARELLNDLNSWRESVGAEMPIPNPDFNPIRDRELGYHKFLIKK